MSEKKKLVIIGGVAGGASTAARARRLSEDAEIIMFERGDYISFANCGLPYHIGGDIPERSRLLVQTPEALNQRFRIDVRINTEVTAIDRLQKIVTAKNLKTGEEYTEPYDELVLSPGAEPFRPAFEGANAKNVFTLRSMNDMDYINDVLHKEKPSRAVVVGGGYIGLEVTEALKKRGLDVVLVELESQVMITADPEMAAPIKQQLALHGIDLRLNISVTGIKEQDDGLTVQLSNGETVDCGLVVMSVGVRPETTLAKQADLTVGERGGIVVDDHMRTSDPDIYAVGDAVEVRDFTGGHKTAIPLAGPANRQGRIAADNIFGRDSAYRDTQGTAICKVFDLSIGMTGMNEKSLKRVKMPYEKVYVHPANHASYYPGASPISFKLIFEPESGKILGAQAVGQEGIDKRIDVIAVAMRGGLTVYDLEHLELSYAPPYGSAKDPVNYAGFVAANALRGDVKLCHYEDVANPADNQYILDVRTKEETQSGTIPGAHNIPVDELRDRLDELPRNKEILVSCQVGLRGYIACRILSQSGFKCRNLTGGFKTWRAFADSLPMPELLETDMSDDTGEGGKEHTEIEEPKHYVKAIDAMGLQCPGPIMRLGKELKTINPGEAVTIRTNEMGFAADIGAWCHSTGNKLINIGTENGVINASIMKGTGIVTSEPSSSRKKKSIVVFSSDFDKVMAAFVIANGAASMGSEVTLFFTFWGLNVLRREEPVRTEKNLIESMFSRMMPRGPHKLGLSKMHMGGVGLKIMKSIMSDKKVDSLPDLIRNAIDNGVKMVACAMTMDVMGIKKEELIDGVEIGGVATYLDHAEDGNVNLFI